MGLNILRKIAAEKIVKVQSLAVFTVLIRRMARNTLTGLVVTKLMGMGKLFGFPQQQKHNDKGQRKQDKSDLRKFTVINLYKEKPWVQNISLFIGM